MAQLIMGAASYLRTIPSKNVRGVVTQAMNLWFKASDASVVQIEGIIADIHEGSVLLDDIQDGSDLRRGRPASHRIYGVGQTINAGSYLINLAVGGFIKLGASSVNDIFLGLCRDFATASVTPSLTW